MKTMTKMMFAVTVAMSGVSAANAAPVFSNTFGPDARSVNTSLSVNGETVVSQGLTISGGGNQGQAVFAPDLSYLDSMGPITLSFAAPVSGFGLNFVSDNLNVILSAYDDLGNLLESGIFTGSPTPNLVRAGYAGFTGYSNISRAVVTTSRGSSSLYIGTVTFVNAGAVPETATWGMMIAGFGMTGAALRTRRRSTKVSFA